MSASASWIPESVFRDLEVDGPGTVLEAGSPAPAEAQRVLLDAGACAPDDADLALRVLASARDALGATGRLFIAARGAAGGRALAALRNRLWPVFHVHRAYRFGHGRGVERFGLAGTTPVEPVSATDGWLIAALRRATALSPQVTTEKFDRNAAGWNGVPGAPDYGHFRWMRRLVAACARPVPGSTALDAGCGAGWVGVEAALLGARVSAFDPSPEMVRHARENAAAARVDVDARVGFGERPPFDQTFDLVLNSGVISFAPDPDDFLEGLDRLVKPGGRLVIGDMNPRSAGMQRRRREKPVLPVREMNGLERDRVAELLRRRGYRVDWVRYYQLTYPVPELIHRTKSHLLCALLLAMNRASSALDAMCGAHAAGLFDSWIIGATKER